jgi:predicted anti-sigma-YlaC factor YlaD
VSAHRTNDCRDFRERLAAALAGGAGTTELGWHEHLLTCGDCRALLEDEEALEALLATLPEPVLPPDLAERVLARLAVERGAALDALLELERTPELPDGLAGRVLAGLAAERTAPAALDDLLDLVPEPEVPVGLAERVLAGLEDERAPVRPALRLLRDGAPWLAALAAGILALVWALTRGEAPARETRMAREGALERELEDEELLAALPLLEDWELLMDEELDLLSGSLDEVDVLLLELAADSEEAEADGEENG